MHQINIIYFLLVIVVEEGMVVVVEDGIVVLPGSVVDVLVDVDDVNEGIVVVVEVAVMRSQHNGPE